jgi:L-methionine (R)-S-oxide reductase
MAESIMKAKEGAPREEQYEQLIPQLQALVEGESDVIANLANIVAALKEAMGFLWIGFYFVRGNELVLGPFQGPVACTRIGFGKGVCGAAWQRKETIIVPDVDAFPGHIACSSLSRSEIVIPVMKNNEVILILDIDSENLNQFNETDGAHLQKVASLVASFA